MLKSHYTVFGCSGLKSLMGYLVLTGKLWGLLSTVPSSYLDPSYSLLLVQGESFLHFLLPNHANLTWVLLSFNCWCCFFCFLFESSNIYYINDNLDKRTWTYIFGACCATTVFIPSFHNYRIWSFLGLGMTTYTAWYLTIAAVVHGQVNQSSMSLIFSSHSTATINIIIFPKMLSFSLYVFCFKKKLKVLCLVKIVQKEGVTHTAPTKLVLYFTGATNILYTFGGHAVTVYAFLFLPFPAISLVSTRLLFAAFAGLSGFEIHRHNHPIYFCLLLKKQH